MAPERRVVTMALDEAPCEEPTEESVLRVILGASLKRSFWGWAPSDWGSRSARMLVEPYMATAKPGTEGNEHMKRHGAHGHAHGKATGFWRLPVRRHQWGQEQYEVTSR